MNALLSVENLGFSYEGKPAVEGLNFSLALGEYLCIVGENGSGKSTLVNGILGLKRPNTGRIIYSSELKRSDIGYLPQQSLAHTSFPASVLEVVLSGRLGQKGAQPFYSKKDRTFARAALALVGVQELDNQWFGSLSGGQRQRVLLARALSIAPDGLKLLILDEPMNGLDPQARSSLYELIAKLNTRQGIAVIMVTHDVNTAVHFANKILLLSTKQHFFGTTEAFAKHELGIEFMRDACGGHCAICGLSHFDEEPSCD